jgi:hypothetical protein
MQLYNFAHVSISHIHAFTYVVKFWDTEGHKETESHGGTANTEFVESRR